MFVDDQEPIWSEALAHGFMPKSVCLCMLQGDSWPPNPEDIPEPSHGRKFRAVNVVKGVWSLLTDLFFNRQEPILVEVVWDTGPRLLRQNPCVYVCRRGTADPQPLRISRSLAMAEFSVKSFTLFMWWRVYEACSQICSLTDRNLFIFFCEPIHVNGLNQREKKPLPGNLQGVNSLLLLAYCNTQLSMPVNW